MAVTIPDRWRAYCGVAAIVALVFALWLLLAPLPGAAEAAEGLILAAAIGAWSRLADL